MASVALFPLANYSNGTKGPFGPIQVADDVTSILFSIARCTSADLTIWPNASTILTITPECSNDGGVTWQECGKTVSPGGISFFRGSEVALGVSGGGLPPPANGIPRQYRVTVDISGGPLRSAATAEVT